MRPPSAPSSLEQVRSELQRLGYLSHRFERLLLQDALVSRGAWRGLPRLAAKVGLLAGSLLAAVNTLALAVANRLFGSAPSDILPLFVHVLVPIVLGTALGFLAVVALFRGVLRAFPRRGLGLVRIGAALVATALLTGIGVGLAAEFLLALPRWQLALAAAALLGVAAGVAKLVADGLLAFGIRLTHDVPHERLVPRRWVGATVLLTSLLVAGAALLLPPKERPAAPVSLPIAAGERVVLIGVDGVLPAELDYLQAGGGLPALRRLSSAGGLVGRYERAPALSPAEFWTTVATGLPGALHGVEALDGFRPLGLETVLARSGPWRAYFRASASILGLAEHRPLLSTRRRAPMFWDLVARGGRPVAAINWWGTYPAEPIAGLVFAHGAYARLAADDPFAVAPAERRAAMAELRDALAGTTLEPTLPGLSAGEASALVERAVRPDALHRELARREWRAGAQAVAVYLPALDLLADGWHGETGRFAELAAAELAAADELIGELAGEAGTLVVVFDPGRRGGGEGRVLLWRVGCAAPTPLAIEPRALASALLRAAGLPQSRELPEPPSFCAWPPPPQIVASYGERVAAAANEAESAAYLESLRSLGYL